MKSAQGLEVIELDHWHGFARATQRALELVETPLVCIHQHDLAFLGHVDMQLVAELQLRDTWPAGPVNFVNFPRFLQRNYREQFRGRSGGLDVGPPVAFECSAGRVLLSRLPQFNDGTHLARVDWYRGIFARSLSEESLRQLQRPGTFIEDVLGQHIIKLAKRSPVKDGQHAASKGVLEVCAEFGCWMYHVDDPQEYVIFHLNGCAHYSHKEHEDLGLPESPYLSEYHHALAARESGKLFQ